VVEPLVVLEGSVESYGHLLNNAPIANQVAEACGLDAVEVAQGMAPGCIENHSPRELRGRKMSCCCIDTLMSTTTTPPRPPFLLWLHERCLSTGRPLLQEVSAEFPTQAINQMFHYGLTQAVERLKGQAGPNQPTDSFRAQADHLGEFNWVGYISRSLRGAGVRDQDLDSATSEVVMKLLHKPGGLFQRWSGEGPIVARFKTSVANAVKNAHKRVKRQTRRHLLSFSEPGVDATAPTHHTAETVENFKAWVELRLGKPALNVLQHIMDGGEVKDLVGRDGLTRYRVKQIVRDLKLELVTFGKGDPLLLRKAKEALAKEEETLKKRFGDRRRAEPSSSAPS
jgi:hypothetical protein